MIYNKNRINECVAIYEKITIAKNANKKFVEITDIDYDENIKSLQDVGYIVTNTNNGIKIEWKEI